MHLIDWNKYDVQVRRGLGKCILDRMISLISIDTLKMYGSHHFSWIQRFIVWGKLSMGKQNERRTFGVESEESSIQHSTLRNEQRSLGMNHMLNCNREGKWNQWVGTIVWRNGIDSIMWLHHGHMIISKSLRLFETGYSRSASISGNNNRYKLKEKIFIYMYIDFFVYWILKIN